MVRRVQLEGCVRFKLRIHPDGTTEIVEEGNAAPEKVEESAPDAS